MIVETVFNLLRRNEENFFAPKLQYFSQFQVRLNTIQAK